MPAEISCMNFCLRLCCPKLWRLKYTELYLLLLFYSVVKNGSSHWEKNIDLHCLRRGYEEEILAEEWRARTSLKKLQNEKFHGLYSSPDFIPLLKPIRVSYVRYVARVGERCIARRLCFGNLWERDYLEDVDVHGRIILKWILNGMGGRGMDWFVSG